MAGIVDASWSASDDGRTENGRRIVGDIDAQYGGARSRSGQVYR